MEAFHTPAFDGGMFVCGRINCRKSWHKSLTVQHPSVALTLTNLGNTVNYGLHHWNSIQFCKDSVPDSSG